MSTAEQEILIIQLLDDALDSFEIIAKRLASKEANCHRDHLFLALRQLGYFFVSKKSPLKSQKNLLSSEEEDIVNRIKDIRDAIAHKDLEINFFNSYLKIVGSQIFKNRDVEIQFGKTKIYLLGEVLHVYKRFRFLFSVAPELPRLAMHPKWRCDEQRLLQVESKLKRKLVNPYYYIFKKRLKS
ncbi:MAG: hypothetical protein HZA77_02125 [Candidatus Schekmanbacteria bacterium]|nr:hypothetical protein [Candidatus Schekmanbacteria bacterium]